VFVNFWVLMSDPGNNLGESSKPLKEGIAVIYKVGRSHCTDLVCRCILKCPGYDIRHLLITVLLASSFVFSNIKPDGKHSGDSLVNELGTVHDGLGE